MAIVFNTFTNGGNATSATALSYTHVCGSGSNRLLVVCVDGDATSDFVTGVTYNGVAMTLIDKVQGSDGGFTQRWMYCFYLLNPAAGSSTVAITASSACDFIGAISADYTGVKQSGQPDASAHQSAGATVATLTTNITTVADNSWVIVFENGFNASGNPSSSSGLSFRGVDSVTVLSILDTNGPVTPAGAYSASTQRSPGGEIYGHIVASFAPVAGVATFFARPYYDMISGGRHGA